MTYDEVLAELVDEFSRIGSMTIQDPASKRTDPMAVADAGKLMRHYTDKMIEIAARKLAATQDALDFANAVKLFMTELENKHITLTIKENQ